MRPTGGLVGRVAPRAPFAIPHSALRTYLTLVKAI